MSNPTVNNEDLLALQSYVTGHDATKYSHLASTTLLLDITHSNLLQQHIEIRFDKHDTISTLKSRIHRQTGTPVQFQRLQVKEGRETGFVIFEIPADFSDDERKLGYFGFENGMNVHCVDLDPYSKSRGGGYEDVSLVEKYRMSDEQYDKRRGTLREWGREMKKNDPSFSLEKHARQHKELMEAQRMHKLGMDIPQGFEFDKAKGEVVRNNNVEEIERIIPGPESIEGIEIDMRCEVSPGGRRGLVKFVGEVKGIGGGGYWVGVFFDEPVGKADGSAKGRTYFEALPGRGGFIRGKNVLVGDFPERDIFDELDSDSEDEL